MNTQKSDERIYQCRLCGRIQDIEGRCRSYGCIGETIPSIQSRLTGAKG